MFHMEIHGNQVYNNNGSHFGGFKFLTSLSQEPRGGLLSRVAAGTPELRQSEPQLNISNEGDPERLYQGKYCNFSPPKSDQQRGADRTDRRNLTQ